MNWYDYGARMYNPAIGRWNGVDALAEKYNSYTPYAYTINNPVLLIDPDGNEIVNPNSKDAQYVKAQLTRTKTGTEIWERMKSSSNRITIYVTNFYEEKNSGFKGERGKMSRLTVDLGTAGGFVASKEYTDGIEFDEFGISSQPDFTSVLAGSTFNEDTGEYEFNEGRDLNMVVDLDIIKGEGLDELETIAEEAVHSTQLFIDLGKFFKKLDPTNGKYIQLSKSQINKILSGLTEDQGTELYNSQRTEKEAKALAKKVKEEKNE